MTIARPLTLALLPAFALASGCVSTTTQSRTWTAEQPQQSWAVRGRVDWVRETVTTQQGNPAGGAAAGAVVGGLLGSVITGQAGGAFAGAVGGAMVGAASSTGSAQSRHYEMFVRFENGAAQSYFFAQPPPFRPGEEVILTPRGFGKVPGQQGAPGPYQQPQPPPQHQQPQPPAQPPAENYPPPPPNYPSN